MTARTKGPVNVRIRRHLGALGLPRLQLQTGLVSGPVARRMEVHIDALIADRQKTVLQALQDGVITLGALDDYARTHPLAGAGIVTLVLQQTTLEDAVTATLPKMGAAKKTKQRYATSANQLLDLVPKTLPVGQLVDVDWEPVFATRKSLADKHHLKRFLSAFLSRYYSKTSDLRYAVMAALPKLPVEEERLTELPRELLDLIIAAARPDLRATFLTLVITGLRISEYLALTPAHLDSTNRRVQVPGTKTTSSKAQISIAEALWDTVASAVPSPLQYKCLRLEWKLALKAAGAPKTLRLHDLRHAHAQYATDLKVPRVRIQESMRHTNGAMTDKYAKKQHGLEVSTALAPYLQSSVAAITADLQTTAE